MDEKTERLTRPMLRPKPKCINFDCPVRTMCWRFRMSPSGTGQAYTKFEQQGADCCPYYEPMTKEQFAVAAEWDELRRNAPKLSKPISED